MSEDDMLATGAVESQEHLTRERFLTRTLAAGAAVAAGGALLAAPGGAVAAPALIRSRGQKSITMWSQTYADAQKWQKFTAQLAADFEKQTGIHVNWEIVPWTSALQRWDLAMTSGQLPDVGDIFFLPSRVIQGKGKWGPVDITKMVKSGTFGAWNRFVPSSQADCMYNNVIYGVPWRIDIRAFVFRNDLWPTAPTTLAQFETMGKQLVAKNPGGKITYAAQTFGNGYHTLDLLGAIWGVKVLKPDLQSSNLDDPKWTAALSWAQKMVQETIFDPAQVTNTQFPSSDYLLKGNLAAQFGGNADVYVVSQTTAPQVLGKLQSAQMPSLQAGQRPRSTAASAPLSIFQNTKDMPSSVAWLKYLISPAVAKSMALAASVGSSDATVQASLYKDKFHSAFPQQALNCWTLDPATPAWAQITSIPEGPLTALATNIFSLKSVSSSIADAHKAINTVLKSYKA